MQNTFDCPYCHEEGAYFNRVCYECPHCDKEWDADDDELTEEESCENN